MTIRFKERRTVSGEDTVIIRVVVGGEWQRCFISVKDAYTLFLDLAEVLADVELCDYCGDLVTLEESGGQGVHKTCLDQAIENGVWEEVL